MATVVEVREDRYRAFSDDFTGRLYREQWRCCKCKQWTDSDDVTWSKNDDGDPYCETCAPKD